MCNYWYAEFSACHDFFSLFVCHSLGQSWTSSISLVSLESRSWSWTSKSWSWNCWVLVLVLDKQVSNPSLVGSQLVFQWSNNTMWMHKGCLQQHRHYALTYSSRQNVQPNHAVCKKKLEVCMRLFLHVGFQPLGALIPTEALLWTPPPGNSQYPNPPLPYPASPVTYFSNMPINVCY